ncbi:MAG: hypothetical protein WBG36_01410 [Ornithinimicrobium sp.]
MTQNDNFAAHGQKKSASNMLSIVSFVLSAIGLFFIPIIFGGAAIITAAVGLSRKEPLSKIALIVAIVATVAGFLLGALVLTANS